MDVTDLNFDIKQKIRETNLGNLTIGGGSSFPFLKENNNVAKPLFAIEIPYVFDKSYPEVLKSAWGSGNLKDIITKAESSSVDMISIKFNITLEYLEKEQKTLKLFLTEFLKSVKKPLILRGANNNEVDLKLIPFLCENAPKESIIAFADENTYEQIVPIASKYNHILVLRSPIDINLAKEFNILSIDKGMMPERILIDPDMGGLGYGLEYGYSIIEKIKCSAFDGDNMLNMPIIAFIGEESYKAKEAKSNAFDKCWGCYDLRSTLWELSSASAIATAGADIVVLWNPLNIDALGAMQL